MNAQPHYPFADRMRFYEKKDEALFIRKQAIKALDEGKRWTHREQMQRAILYWQSAKFYWKRSQKGAMA